MKRFKNCKARTASILTNIRTEKREEKEEEKDRVTTSPINKKKSIKIYRSNKLPLRIFICLLLLQHNSVKKIHIFKRLKEK